MFVQDEIIDTKIIEQSILACIAQNPPLIYQVELTEEDFDKYTDVEYNRSLFEILDYIARKKDMEHGRFDEVTLINYIDKFHNVREIFEEELGDKNDNAEQAISKYIRTLKKLDVDPSSIDMYIKDLQKDVAINDLIARNDNLKDKFIQDYQKMSLEEVLGLAERTTLEVTDEYTNQTHQAEHIAEGMRDGYLSREVNNKGFTGQPSPYPQVDTFSQGLLRDGSVLIINAQTGVGKSIMLKNIVKKVGVDDGKPVYWGANEMPKHEQRDRMVAEIAGLPPNYIENGIYNKKGNEKMRKRVLDAVKTLEESPIYIDLIRGYSADKLVRRARYYKNKYDIQGFVWDYVKRSSAFGGSDEALRHWLGDVVNRMKEDIADPLGIWVATASQAKTYQEMFSAESQDIERHSTAYAILKKISSEEREEHLLMGDYAFVIKKNRHGSEHDFTNNGECIEMNLDQERLLFVEQ